MRARVVAGLLAVAVVLLGAACGGDDERTGDPTPDDALRVASFDFLESRVLAELYAQAAESAGVPVVRLGVLGPREVTGPALELDQIDLVPEYLGTALGFAGATEADPDPDSARTELVERLAPRGLTALEASPAEDVNVVVVTKETADRLGLNLVSDLAPVASSLRFGGPAECPERDLCLIGLRETYGLEFAEFVPQTSLTFTAEALRRGEIDVGLLFSTAAELEDTRLVVLGDDRMLQPAENIVPVIRIDALDRWGSELADSLDDVSAALTTLELRRLNRRAGRGEPIAELVGDWLASQQAPDPS